MDSSRMPIESEDGFTALEREIYEEHAEHFPVELDDDFYNDDMMMGVDA